MFERITSVQEISVDIHLVAIGSHKNGSPHEGRGLFVTMVDETSTILLPDGEIELDWENAWNAEPDFIWMPLTEQGFSFFPYEPRVEWSLEQEEFEVLWNARQDGEQLMYFYGKALITPEVSYEWDFDNNEIQDDFVTKIEHPLYKSLRLGSRNLKIARYVLIPSDPG